MSCLKLFFFRCKLETVIWSAIFRKLKPWEKHRNEDMLYYAAGENGPDLGEKWNVSSLEPTVNQKKCTR